MLAHHRRLRHSSRARLVLSPRAAAPRARSPHVILTAGSGTVYDSVRPRGLEDGGPRSGSRRCQLPDGDGEEQIDSSGPGEQENHPA